MQMTVLAAVQSDRLVVILAGEKLVDDPAAVAASEALANHFAPGPIVVGPVVADLTLAPASARAALSGIRAARAWPEGPQVMAAVDLLSSPVIQMPLRGSSTRSTAPSRQPVETSWTQLSPSSITAAQWKARVGRCSFTPTPCATDLNESKTSLATPRRILEKPMCCA